MSVTDAGQMLPRYAPGDRVVALAGNPNVGKSTVFNGLTGLRQHTGNWPGKTVASAAGRCRTSRRQTGSYILVDIPGTYSLLAHSAEEEVARDYLCFGGADGVVIVCDATCLERNLGLVLQVIEIAPRRPTVVCVNLMDEARRKGITLDLAALEAQLGVPVVGMTARKKRELARLPAALDAVFADSQRPPAPTVRYPAPIEAALDILTPALAACADGTPSPRWLALRLLCGDALPDSCLHAEPPIAAALAQAKHALTAAGIDEKALTDLLVATLVTRAEAISQAAVRTAQPYSPLDRRLDRILTSRATGYPVMLALLALIFWLTIEGANYPSAWLSAGFAWIEARLTALFAALHAPAWLHGALVEGVWRTLGWVVSVMLPPMAIFFPLFTLLEDAGYLPRIAYNLDRPFRACHACGKQALCMCMGLGCNAAGVTGCRIIDSPRERLLAVLTNSFVPCNGRFPTLIALITMFFAGTAGGFAASLESALMLTGIILLGVLATFGMTRLLSATLLRGTPSAFTLELPPYRRPQIGRVIVRSIFDRTLFVLGRAAAVAAPAGLVIWLMANITVGDASLLAHTAAFLDPAARLIGLDGVILLAFILGFPANEIVLPIALMTYTAGGSLIQLGSLTDLHTLLIANGWTTTTAVCVAIFSLFHWPCSTTLWTVRKETGSPKWAALSAALPTATGILVCAAINLIF